MLLKEVAAWKWGLENIQYQPQRINYKKVFKKKKKQETRGWDSVRHPQEVSSRIKGLFK